MSKRLKRTNARPNSSERNFFSELNKSKNNVVNLNQYRKPLKQKVALLPKNLAQETYIEALENSSIDIVFATGPAGTGKTMLAVLAAIDQLKNQKIDKIVITRPAVGVDGEKHGFLPGDLNAKMEPWTRPIFDVLHEYYSPKETSMMLEEQILEISPLSFMRGRTFKKSWIIADEMQNATPNQMKMLLTRIGDGSKMVVNGDVKQTDRAIGENGLIDFDKLLQNFGNSKYIQWVKFNHNDIERHPAVGEILKIYGDE